MCWCVGVLVRWCVGVNLECACCCSVYALLVCVCLLTDERYIPSHAFDALLICLIPAELRED